MCLTIFSSFRWLGDTDDHGEWQAAYDFLLTFSSNHALSRLVLRRTFSHFWSVALLHAATLVMEGTILPWRLMECYFHRLNSLPDIQTTAPKHWRHICQGTWRENKKCTTQKLCNQTRVIAQLCWQSRWFSKQAEPHFSLPTTTTTFANNAVILYSLQLSAQNDRHHFCSRWAWVSQCPTDFFLHSFQDKTSEDKWRRFRRGRTAFQSPNQHFQSTQRNSKQYQPHHFFIYWWLLKK